MVDQVELCWQPIETAQDERIALMTDGDRVTIGKKLDWGNGEVEFIDYTVPEYIIRPYHPTHWMPLPDPPHPNNTGEV